jgi:hypothetical protein
VKLETALQVAKDIAAAYRKWGKQANPPYTQHQLCEALAALDAAGHFNSNIGEELTKVKRQLAAALAREAARKNA